MIHDVMRGAVIGDRSARSSTTKGLDQNTCTISGLAKAPHSADVKSTFSGGYSNVEAFVSPHTKSRSKTLEYL